jgi:hypothetical protein
LRRFSSSRPARRDNPDRDYIIVPFDIGVNDKEQLLAGGPYRDPAFFSIASIIFQSRERQRIVEHQHRLLEGDAVFRPV